MGLDKVFKLRGETSYSQARRVGELLFIAGTVSWDDDFAVVGDGDYRVQIDTIYRDIARTLEHYGLDASALVKETVYTLDMDPLLAVNASRMAWLGQAAPPASTWIAVERLANTKLMLEVEAVVALPPQGESPSGERGMHSLRSVEQDFGFTQAIRAGHLLFVSGIVSWDRAGAPTHPGDLSAQLTNVYEELGETLAAFGVSYREIVQESIFTRDMPALVSAAPLRATYYGENPLPTSTWIQVERLVHPDLLIEIAAVADLS